MARFWLRLRATEIHLPIGEVMIGRGPECFLRVDEPMVSRRHARLLITTEGVSLEDLGSRNGSQVNGVAITEPCELVPGDEITIGTQPFTLECDDPAMRRRESERVMPQGAIPTAASSAGETGPVTLAMPVVPTSASSLRSLSGPDPAAPLALPSAGASLGYCIKCGAPQGDAAICPRCGNPYRNEFSETPVTTAGRDSSFHLFWALSDKVLAMGRVDEAERMMGPRLGELLSRAEGGSIPADIMVGECLRRVLKLAGATRRDRWFAWFFDYARVCRYRMPLVLLDEVYAQMFTARPAVGAQIVAYAQALRDDALGLRLATLRRLCRD